MTVNTMCLIFMNYIYNIHLYNSNMYVYIKHTKQYLETITHIWK